MHGVSRRPKDGAADANCDRCGRSAQRPSNLPGVSIPSRALTGCPEHGDLARSRSDSAPPIRDVRGRAGGDWPVWVNTEVETLHPQTNFFLFFRPLQESPCLAPVRKLDCRTAQGPYRFFRFEELGCDSLRGTARLRSSSRVVSRLRADLVYLAFALKIWGFCDVAPGSHASKYSRHQL